MILNISFQPSDEDDGDGVAAIQKSQYSEYDLEKFPLFWLFFYL